MCILRACLNCQIDLGSLSEPSAFQTFRLCPIVERQHLNDQTPLEPGAESGYWSRRPSTIGKSLDTYAQRRQDAPQVQVRAPGLDKPTNPAGDSTPSQGY